MHYIYYFLLFQQMYLFKDYIRTIIQITQLPCESSIHEQYRYISHAHCHLSDDIVYIPVLQVN